MFRKSPINPLVPRTAGSFYSVHSANPDVIRFRGRSLLIFRGQDERGHDQIGVAYNKGRSFDPIHWDFPNRAAIEVSRDPLAFDSGHILDPAGVVLHNQLFVYYTAHRSDWDSWNVPSHIGLAISENGSDFRKLDQPIIEGMAPEVIQHQGRVHLIFQRLNPNGTLSFYKAISPDGKGFEETSVELILEPSRERDQFDGFSISTARVWRENGWFVMAYGGCRRFVDYPEAIGIARSKDLLRWERHPLNPVLSRGRAGSWDEGAVWFATGYRTGNCTYLFYEGTGRLPSARNNPALARLCRHSDYGGYAECSFSQIGVAATSQLLSDW